MTALLQRMSAMLRPARLVQLGVGTRIYVTIGVIVVLTIAASTLASLSFRRVDENVRSLVAERYPVVGISRELAQAATETVAIAPKLAEASTEGDRALAMARFEEADTRMRAFIDQLAGRRAIDKGQFLGVIDQLKKEFYAANGAARQRIAAMEQKTAQAALLAKAHEAFNQALISIVDEAQFNLLIGLEGAAASKEGEDNKGALQKLSDRELVLYGAGLSLLSEVNQVYGLLREVIVLDRVELLGPALDRYQALSKRVAKVLADAEKAAADPKRRAVTEAVLAFGKGDNSLFKLRERDFAARKVLATSLLAAAETANGLQSEIDRVVGEAQTAAADATRSTTALISTSSLWLIIIGAASALAACAIAYFYVRPFIVLRLRRLSQATRAIADGQFETEVDARSGDEIGQVAQAVVVFRDAAIEKIRLEEQSEEQRRVAREERMRNDAARAAAAKEVEAVVAALGAGLDHLAKGDLTYRLNEDMPAEYKKLQDDFNAAIAQLQDTVGAIAGATSEVTSAAAEISASTTDLSQRTEEQAASIEQTSASMEEMAATVKKNAENAQQANQFAANTRTVADRGGEVVDKAVGAMARIEESSHKISDIISVIDEIAFQTNLLALNAAVEAARAGEAGRGFAVVASEVRRLAQRSAQAAKDIKELINHSSGQVKEGVDLVNRAGSSLADIVASIKHVADIVAEIANASVEQATGIDQVNRALNQMDETTQQNSALVEQNAATTKMLEQLSAAMGERVGVFRLGADETADVGPAQVAPLGHARQTHVA